MSLELTGLDTGAGVDISSNDFMMSRTIAEALHAHYPGHLWAVTCEGKTGLITIRDLFLSGAYGYVLKIGDVFSISDLERKAIMGAGEILERFKMERGRFDEAKYHTMKTDFAGRLEFDK
jgi:hypothetical protein